MKMKYKNVFLKKKKKKKAGFGEMVSFSWRSKGIGFSEVGSTHLGGVRSHTVPSVACCAVLMQFQCLEFCAHLRRPLSTSGVAALKSL